MESFALSSGKISKKEATWVTVFSIVTAIVVLLICTKSSILYPLNDWVDANCYFSVGKAMMNGKVLYRDIYDHKGPLLYALHAFAYVISKDSFLGVFLFEIAACTLFLISVYKILRLYVDKIAIVALPVIAAVLYSAYSFAHGDSAEEFCLPLVSWSLYAMLSYFKTGYPGRIGAKNLLVNGILAGCVMCIKFTMLGFHFGWMLTLIVIYAWKKDWKAIIVDGMTFLLGMGIATVPFFLYFGVHGAIINWWEGYIYNNVFVYTADSAFSFAQIAKSILRNTLLTFKENVQYSIFIIVGVLFFMYQHRRNILQCVGMGLLCMFSAIGIYFGSQAYYLYYGFILSVFAVLGCIPVLMWVQSWIRKRNHINRKGATLCVAAVLLLLGGVFCYNRSSNVYLLGYPQEEMVQYKFKEIIEETEDPTLLNYGFLDGGFYTVCDIVPTCKYFAKFNIPLRSIYLSQENLIYLGMVDYVVTRNFELDSKFDKYQLVAEDSFWFDGYDHEYYLYRLISK